MMKKNTLLFIALLGTLAFLIGCEKKEKEKPKETFKSRKYYIEHGKEAILRANECKEMNTVKTEAVRLDCLHAEYAVSYNSI